MKKKNTETVVFRLDPRNPPQMPADEIRALKRMPDKAINYGDIPPLEGHRWTTPGALVPKGGVSCAEHFAEGNEDA